MMTLTPPLLELITQQFGLQRVEQQSPLVAPQPPQQVDCGRLLDRLERTIDLILPDTNERTRAAVIVAPILIEVAVSYQLSLYSGTAFNAEINQGLSGTVDHLLSRALPPRSTIVPPITAVVETKSRARGISHCLMQMVAAQRVNAHPAPVYGVVTTGLLWQFLQLEGTTVTIDLTPYPLFATTAPLASLVSLDLAEPHRTAIEPLLSLLVPMVSGKSADSPGA